MALGGRAEISVDAFPGHTLHGHVLGFAPASGRRSPWRTRGMTEAETNVPPKISACP
jgi:hypothetical protein